VQGLHYPLAVSRATLVPDEYRSKVPTKGWKHKYKYKSESGRGECEVESRKRDPGVRTFKYRTPRHTTPQCRSKVKP